MKSRLSFLVFVPIVLFISACGSGGEMKAVPGAPAITMQPTAQTTPLGQTATFTVTASGTPPLRFQWSRNGTVISGATSASYTTPAVALVDGGSSFTVTVSNDQASVTSSAAQLTVGPRTPQAGDWRFQGIDLPTGTLAGATDMVSFATFTGTNTIGTPLQVGLVPGFNCGSADPFSCAWDFFWFAAPGGAQWPTTVYKSDAFIDLSADLNLLAAPNIVITSLDLEPGSQIFAVSWLQTSAPGGFVYGSHVVPPAQIQAVATQEGAQGRVVTAIAFDAAGNANILSYGWQSDTATVYDVQVFTTTSLDSDALVTQLTDMANQGYIFTAMGGNTANGLVLIGYRVQGDTLPRPLEVFLDTSHQGQVSGNLQSIWRTVQGTTPSSAVQFAQQ